MQIQTQEILSWFGPHDLHLVPKQPAWDFPYPWCCTPKINTLYATWQIPFVKYIQLFLHQEGNNTLYNFSSTKDALVQSFSLSNYKQPYKFWICMSSWTRTLIGGLSEFFSKGLEFEWRIESGNSFLKNRFLNRLFGQKLLIWMGVFSLGQHPYL